MLSKPKKICHFFVENGLNISGSGDILLSGSRDSSRTSHVSELISSVISAKSNENLPSLRKSFCSQQRNTPAMDHSVFVSCWAFLCRFESRFLAGPSLPRMGKRPAFFMFRRSLVRRNDTLPPRGRHASFRLSPQSSNSSRRKFVHLAALSYFLNIFPNATKRFLALFFQFFPHISQYHLSKTLRG